MNNRRVDLQMEKFVCQCGKEEYYPVGFLSEYARDRFLCSACREVVLENRVAKKSDDGKKLLTED